MANQDVAITDSQYLQDQTRTRAILRIFLPTEREEWPCMGTKGFVLDYFAVATLLNS